MVSYVYVHFFRQNRPCCQAIPGIGYRNFENFALFANSGVFVMVFNVYLHFFRQNRLCFQTIPGIGYRNFENFALFANNGLFIMVSNVYLHFFRQNRLCCLKVCKLINTRFTIRLVTSSIFISLFLA